MSRMAPEVTLESAVVESRPPRPAARAGARSRSGTRLSRGVAVAVTLAIVAVVGIADYLTGHDILLSIFYLVPVAIAAWSVGRAFAVATALLSVGAWVVGDIAAGAVYGRPFVVVWNASITLAFYIVVVALIGRLRGMHRDLEERVRLRTVALTEEMAERQRLEREILEIGENERRRIGRDLHDSLGQLLTGTALAGEVLKEKLAARELDEVSDLTRLVTMVEEAIEQTRSLSRGLDPIEMDGLGLAHGLRELAARTSALSPARCEFHSSTDPLVRDPGTAIHIYRIVQEAITNALKHGRADAIQVTLEGEPGELVLIVTDNGVGLPEPGRRDTGMGLRIMAHRAAVVGGSFAARRLASGGTEIECRIPDP